MTEGWFKTKVAGALATLRDEYPPLYQRMAERIGERAVQVEVDGEPVTICFDGRDPFGAVDVEPAVYCATDSQTIVDLADAKRSVEEAIWDRAIILRGGVEDLLAFHEALQAFLHGAVRSPSFPVHLARFRQEAARRQR